MEIVLALAMALAFVLLREFARRFGFAHLNLKQVLLLDVVVAVLNLLFLSLLVKSGELSAVTALLALALSCAVGSIGWLWLARREFAFCLLAVHGTIKQSWQLGKWLLCGQLAIQVQGYVTYWLSMLIAGAAVTGIYAACMSLVGFLNPLLFGFYNILTPRSVRVLHNGGSAALRRDAARNSLVIAAVISPLCLLLIMFGDDLLRLIYAGGEYSGSGQILAILAISSLAAAVGAPASIALATAEHGRALAAVMGATALLNVILVWYLMGLWGLVGAAYAVLIAEVLGSVGRWASFLALVPNAGKGEAG
jgi:O-antigen/teichoic acid export membrane protein